MGMANTREKQKELAKVIERYFGADAGYLDISCFDLARVIIEAGWTKPMRCKDCKFWKDDILRDDDEMKCCSIGFYMTKGDKFCSFGKPKGE